MSYYYNYYIGYEVEGKVYPLGPFNSIGKICPVFYKSASYASELWQRFAPVEEEQVSDELREYFESENWKGEKEVAVKYCYIDSLPTGSPIKKGYFRIDDVKNYEANNGSYCDEFEYDYMSPEEYVERFKTEMALGAPPEQEDADGSVYYGPSVRDYMYYAYLDRKSEEYEAEKLREASENLWWYGEMPEGAKAVAILSEG